MEVIKDFSFTNETDEDLMVIISMKDDPVACNRAFSEFHKRYGKFIYGMASKVASNLPNSIELRDAVYQNTLIDVFNYSSSFSVRGERDPEKIKMRILGWLVKIEKTELLSLLRNRSQIIDPEELNKLYEEDPDNADENHDQPTYNQVIVDKTLGLLSERDQDIFMTYWLYYEKGKGDQAKNLPPDVLGDLVSKYETTTINIRKIIERSKRKAFTYLLENYKTK